MAYDVHELGCHFVARHAGLYQRHGLEPQLVDAKVAGADLPDRCFRAACAAALAGWLNGDDIRVVFVAAEKPMFWLYGTPGLQELSGLQGKTIAGYPPPAPPALFLRYLLDQEGINGVDFLPALDDEARLGMLADGSAAAALLSSRVAPDAADSSGLEPLLFLGDQLRIATTGLAATPAFCAEEPGLIAAMCACYAEALALIHGDPEALASALRAGIETVRGSVDALVPVLRACYTSNGRSSSEHLQAGAELVAAIMGVQVPQPVDQLYDFSFLD